MVESGKHRKSPDGNLGGGYGGPEKGKGAHCTGGIGVHNSGTNQIQISTHGGILSSGEDDRGGCGTLRL